jgi:hypothetical protein
VDDVKCGKISSESDYKLGPMERSPEVGPVLYNTVQSAICTILGTVGRSLPQEPTCAVHCTAQVQVISHDVTL